jgi:hypothetical protein
LPLIVWISPKSGNQHDVRVKVSPVSKALPSEMISVAIRPQVRLVQGNMSAADLALLKKWLDLNKEAIAKLWDGEIEYTQDAIAAIRAIG